MKKIDLKNIITLLVIITLCVMTFIDRDFYDIFKMVCTSVVTYYYTRNDTKSTHYKGGDTN